MTDDTSVKTNVARSTTARVFNPAPSARAPQPAANVTATATTTATTVVPSTQADDASLSVPQPLSAAGQQTTSTPPSPIDQQEDLADFPTQESGQDAVQSQDHQDFFGLTDDAAGGAADLVSRYDLSDDDAKKTDDIDSTVDLGNDLLNNNSLPAAPSTDAPEGKKNPLDVLEELLNQANEATSGKEAAPDPEAEKAKESELIRKELEEKAKKQAIVDQQLIEVQRAALEEDRQHGSASQARTQQEDAKQQDRQSKAAAGDGFEIDQLGHTKI